MWYAVEVLEYKNKSDTELSVYNLSSSLLEDILEVVEDYNQGHVQREKDTIRVKDKHRERFFFADRETRKQKVCELI